MVFQIIEINAFIHYFCGVNSDKKEFYDRE